MRKIRLKEVNYFAWDPTWLHEDSNSCLSDFKTMMCWQVFNNQLSLGRNRALICWLCWFLWCKHSHRGQVPVTKVITELKRDMHHWLYEANMTQCQLVTATTMLSPPLLDPLFSYSQGHWGDLFSVWVYNWASRGKLLASGSPDARVWNFLLWVRKVSGH